MVEGQRPQLMFVDGKMQLVKPSMVAAPVTMKRESEAVVDYKNRKLSSLDHLRRSKKQMARRWTP